MKVPLIWLKDYIDLNKTSKEIASSFTSLGLMLDKPIENNVLDLEHRMDRADWLSITGCARDLAAFENAKFKFPKVHKEKGKEPTKESSVEIKVECPDLVNRFNTRVFRNIKVKESPQWLKERLEAYGMPSINNIVDITNFVMVELGQPMHAQDIDRMETPEIIIRRAKKGEKVKTLLGEEVELDPDIFVLTQNDKASVIGGIVGGESTGVDSTAKNIVLDAGNYNQTSVRRNSRKLKIQNETVLRYDKYLNPELTQIAMERAVGLILELAGGDYYENYDYYPKKKHTNPMTLRYKRIKTLSGMEIEPPKVKNILELLEYKILDEDKKGLTLEIPYFRTDIEVEDDLVADVLRINNYEKIPVTSISAAPPKEITQSIYKYEEKLRDACSKLGLHEHITDPLVAKNDNDKKQVVLENSQSSGKNSLRTTIYQTLAPITEMYKKQNILKFGLFEIGKTFELIGKGDSIENYSEQRVLEVIYHEENLNPYKTSLKIKKLLGGLLKEMGVQNYYFQNENFEYKPGNKTLVKQEELLLGELKYDSFAIFTEELQKAETANTRIKHDISASTYEDISLVINVGAIMGETIRSIKALNSSITEVYVIDEYQDEKLGDNKKGVTIRIEFTTDKNSATNLKGKVLEIISKNPEIEIRM